MQDEGRQKSKKNGPKAGPKIDRRAGRTRAALNEVLLDAGLKGEIDALDVGALAEKAGIGRSTFYAHYASKADFIAGSYVDMIGRAEAAAAGLDCTRADLLPARILFTHIAEAREFARSLLASLDGLSVFAAGDAKLRAIVEANLAKRKPDWTQARRREAAVFITGGFSALLRWQVETEQDPEKTYAAYADLVRRALTAD